MQGYQLSFFTQQDRRHGGKPLAHWLLELAREMGVGGATVLAASEGFGRERRIHAAHFVELAEQPLEVQMAVSTEQCERLFRRLEEEDVRVFYTKAAIEFGVTGGEGPPGAPPRAEPPPR